MLCFQMLFLRTMPLAGRGRGKKKMAPMKNINKSRREGKGAKGKHYITD